MREAFPWDHTPKYLLRDRDAIYGNEFAAMTQDMEMEEILTAPRSPWQNPYVERLVSSIRRECLDHVIGWNQRIKSRCGELCGTILSNMMTERILGSARKRLVADPDLHQPAESSPTRDWAVCIIATTTQPDIRGFATGAPTPKLTPDNSYGRFLGPGNSFSDAPSYTNFNFGERQGVRVDCLCVLVRLLSR